MFPIRFCFFLFMFSQSVSASCFCSVYVSVFPISQCFGWRNSSTARQRLCFCTEFEHRWTNASSLGFCFYVPNLFLCVSVFSICFCFQSMLRMGKQFDRKTEIMFCTEFEHRWANASCLGFCFYVPNLFLSVSFFPICFCFLSLFEFLFSQSINGFGWGNSSTARIATCYVYVSVFPVCFCLCFCSSWIQKCCSFVLSSSMSDLTSFSPGASTVCFNFATLLSLDPDAQSISSQERIE